MTKKIIEYWFPIKEIGLESIKEKRKGVGKISTIHTYFARRPTCAARAIILSSLLDTPEKNEELPNIFQLINDYGKRELPNYVNFKNNQIMLTDALKKIINHQEMNPVEIKAFDPFSGGGTFPLEIENLGLQSFSSDINPVAILIQKATCEYPFKYKSNLVELLEKYFNIVYQKLIEKVKSIYGSSAYYFWTRQLSCPNCQLIIPLIKNFDLTKKNQEALIPFIPDIKQGNIINFEIGSPNKNNAYFKKGEVYCPRCKRKITNQEVFDSVSKNENFRLLAVYDMGEELKLEIHGKFRIASEIDIQNASINKETELDLIKKEYPDIEIQVPEKVIHWGAIKKYGIDSFIKMYNGRQLRLFRIFLQIFNEIKDDIQNEKIDDNLKRAIFLYLSLGISKMADNNSTFTILNSVRTPCVAKTFSRAGLFMTGTFMEINPLIPNITGSWMTIFKDLKYTLTNIINQSSLNSNLISIKQMNAMDLEYENDSMDFCFTDPPYYDNMPYAVASDFYYTWLRLFLKDFYPELLLTKETPKDIELIQDGFRHGSSKKSKLFYEQGMAKAFSEIYRVLKKEGLAVIIFAHKKLDAWETLLQAIVDSKFVITASWPLLMESLSPLRTQNIISLDSVVILICRKKDREKIKYFDEEFKKTLEHNIFDKIERNWRLGIRGADFFLSAIGPAIEEISQYENVLDIKNDQPIKIKEYLEFIDQILLKFSLNKILNKMDIASDAKTRLYLVWRLSYKTAKIPYDELWKFTKALGLNEHELEPFFIKKVKVKSNTFYECLELHEKIDQFKKTIYESDSLIENLQYVAYLWSENDSKLDAIVNKIQNKYGNPFWYVAQTLCDLTPEADEIKMISGLLKKYGYYIEKHSIIKEKINQNQKSQASLDKFTQHASTDLEEYNNNNEETSNKEENDEDIFDEEEDE